MANTHHAFEYLENPLEAASTTVLFGDSRFLKSRCLDILKSQLFADDGDDINFIRSEGSQLQLKDVYDELSTVSLFGGGQRVMVVNEADKFVSNHRSELESFVQSGHSGVLVLDVGTWQSNTKLYKAVNGNGLQIDCRLPAKGRGIDRKKVAKWLGQWALAHHQIKVSQVIAEYMMDLVGTEIGLIDQNLAKLALYLEPKSKVTEEHVNEFVGGWQTKTIWQLIDSAMDGHLPTALNQLDRLMQDGESPQALLGQISWSLRRYAMAFEEANRFTRAGRRMNVDQVMDAAGFRFPPERKKAMQHLKRLGRNRGNNLYKLLLDCDLALKSSHSSMPRARTALEQLIVELSRDDG